MLCGFQVGMRLAVRFFLERTLQLLPAFFRAEVGRIDQRNLLLGGEHLRALAHHHHVRGMFHHRARQQDRVLHRVHAGHCARTQRGAVHQ
ncbi:hypothetical protein D9M73_221650 [compost metagenome]